MNSISNVIEAVKPHRKQLTTKLTTDISTGINKLNTTDTTDVSSKYECDHLFEQLSDLVNDNFRAWYCSKFYKLGKDKVLELASIARADGQYPSKLFSFLLSRK